MQTGGSAITGYRVFYGLEEPNAQFGADLSAETRSVNVTELGTGAKYYFAIKAVNLAGASSSSNIRNVTAMSVPGAPTALVATSSGGKVSLSWQPPASSGGSAVTGYAIYRALGGTATLLESVSASTLVYVDSNGTAGTTYTYYVMASNAIGTGASSVPVSAASQVSVDNTLLYVAVAICVIVLVAVVAWLLKRRE